MVKERKPHSLPSEEMLNTLKELCSDRKNTVFVVSGKERHSLAKVFGHIPRLGIAAEHGMYISWPSHKRTERRQWDTLVPITDRSWRSLTMTIMEVYTSRTHGSYIEETEMKVLWQYRDADLEFGYLQARELEDHLSNCLRGFPVDILHGGMEEGGYVEVRPKGVNKGVLAMKGIKNFPSIGQSERVDFALVLGDHAVPSKYIPRISRRVRTVCKRMHWFGSQTWQFNILPTDIDLIMLRSIFILVNVQSFKIRKVIVAKSSVNIYLVLG